VSAGFTSTGSAQADESLRRAAHQVLMGSFSGPVVPAWLLRRLDAGLGAVCLFGSNLGGTRLDGDGGPDPHVRNVTAPLLAAAPHLVIATDEEGGDVTRLDARTGSRFPGALALGTADDADLTREVSAGIGRRLRAAGVRMDLAPVADVNVEADNPIIGVRSYGEDPALVARHVAAAVTGLQSAGVAACPKHFPGHGGTRDDSHTDVPWLDVDPDVLERRELVPFRAAVAAGTLSLMAAHIVFEALDPRQPASTSPAVVRLLREDLGFTGCVVSDALDMAGVSKPHGGVPNAAVAALDAGVDLLCLGSEFDDDMTAAVVAAVLRAVDDGTLPAQRLFEAAGAVARLADRLAVPPAVPSTEPAGDPGAPTADLRASLRAASDALRVDGDLPPTAGALVVELAVPPTIAAGVVAWDLAGALARRVPGVEQADCGPDDDAAPLLARAAGRPLVAVVRDAHRHHWVRHRLAQLAAARPDLVVVETGWPGPEPLPGAARVWTRGAAAVSLEAAADLLAGAGTNSGAGTAAASGAAGRPR
jgi:beta-N-acetylhexosaminidase